MTDSAPFASVLSGLRVVDLGDTLATAAATLVLAEAGADVVMAEPPGGFDLRRRPGFRTWGRSKRSVIVDVETDEGLGELDELLAGADVLVHALGPSRAASRGLDGASLAERHPELVVSSVLAWPANHRLADAPVDDITMLAHLGILDEQEGGREGPIYVRFPLGSWPAAWLAVIGIMSRLIERGRCGRTGPAHTSLAQGALIPMMMHWSRAETPSDFLSVGMPKNDMRTPLFECSDGRWVHSMPPNADDTPLMKEVFEEMGAARVAKENEGATDSEPGGFPNWGANRAAYRRRPADAWLQNLWDHDIPAQEAAPFGSILSDGQARVNGYVVGIDDPSEGRIAVPGLPLTLDPPARVAHPAPALGDGRSGAAAPASPEATATRRQPGRGPLAGLKVLDFGNFLAGPLGPMLLADLGATVVKVEATTGDPMRFVDWPFAGCQRGKRAVALDLKSPETRPVVDALLRWADVVHHNLRLPAARRLGLDADAVRAVNPDAIFCHVSSYGPTGPRADWPGYDQLFQATCGWEMMGAGEDNPPMWHRFGFMDHLCAMSSVAATLLAVYQQDRTGAATDVAASLLGAGAMTNSETFLRSDGTLAEVPMLDQQQTNVGPGQRILETADGWIAVSAVDSAAVDALCTVTGAADPSALPAAARSHGAADLVARLVAAGVAAAVVRREQRYPFFDDPDHTAAGMVATYPHPEWGRFEQPGSPWWFDNQEVVLDRAPPVLGQQTVEVLTEVGVDAATIASLLENGSAVAAPSP